jgi:hypothetical protein
VQVPDESEIEEYLMPALKAVMHLFVKAIGD